MSKSEGFTLIELLIVIAIGGILLGIGVGAMKGESFIPSKQSCLSQHGKWTEGYERGHYTQLCTYN